MQVPDQGPHALHDPASFPPEVLEPIRRQRRVYRRARDRSMPERPLDRCWHSAPAITWKNCLRTRSKFTSGKGSWLDGG
jgi:hypothetical protein